MTQYNFNEVVKAGTHGGLFHADDVFAYVILAKAFKGVELTRTRNPKLLEDLDIVFDVGGGKFDHHTNDKVYRENGVPYAAFGLIFKEFGRQVIRNYGINDSEDIETIFNNIDKTLIEGIDAVDNGVSIETDIHIPSISGAISGFNPTWDSSEDFDEAFFKAVSFAEVIFENKMNSELATVRAKNMVKEAFDNRENPKVLVLDRPCNWQTALLDLDSNEEVEFVVFPDSQQGYRVQVVPVVAGKFEARKDLPESWAGKSPDELNDIISIDDAIFCHPGRFIAGAHSKESIMRMTELAIQE